MIVPFVFFTLIGLLCDIAQHFIMRDSIWDSIYSCFIQLVTMGFAWCNAPLWFLLSLFIARFVTLKFNGSYPWLWCLVGLCIAIIHNNFFYERFNYLGNCSLALFYYIIGFKLKNAHKNYLVSIFCLGIYMIVYFLFPVFLDIRSNTTPYGNYLVAITSVIPAIIGFNYLFVNLKSQILRILAFWEKMQWFFLLSIGQPCCCLK